MTIVADNLEPQVPRSAARSYARLNTRPLTELPRPEAPRPAAEPVTLERIGDFLELDLRRVFAWLRAGLLLTAVLAATGAIAGGAFAVLAKPKFTVSSDILIDPANLQVVGDDLFAKPGQIDTQLLAAGSKLRVLGSGNVLSRVVADLGLEADPEFVPDGATLPPDVTALASLRKAVAVTGDPRSFVATLAVTTESADKSIAISDAIVEAFRDELTAAEAEGAARTVEGLNARLGELKAAVNDAEAAVETYKRDNGLQASAGELTSALSLNQINAQVLDAQARVIEAQTAYDELMSGGVVPGSAGTQQSALDGLRTQYATARQQLDSQSLIYGARHPIITRLQGDVAALETQLAAETARIEAAAKARVDEAQAALDALRQSSAAQQATVFSDNAALVRLRELERDAESKAAVYEAFLARSQQLAEQGQLDTTNIRVISTAVPPPARSWPPRTLVLIVAGAAAGLFGGLLLALGLGAWRDLRRARV